MDTTAFPVAELRQPTLATQLMAAITSSIGSPDVTVHALDTTTAQHVPVIDFALSGLPRRVVHRGLGEVLFNEHAAPTERGSCDGALVAVLRFGEHHAVIDADRGHAEFDDDNDAYLIGVAHVLPSAPQAQALAAQCALKRRQRACSDALRRTIELALPLPAHVVAKAVHDAMTSAVAPERMPWLHAVRYFLDRPDLEVMR
jgi:hypothetical protein